MHLLFVLLSLVSTVTGSLSSCGNQDVTSSVLNFLPGYFSAARAAATEITTLLLNNITGAGTILPYSPSYQPYSTTGALSTTRQILWSVAQSSGLAPGISFYPSNLWESYGQPLSNGVWYGTFVAPGTITRTRYSVSQTTGAYGSVYSTQPYNASTRPWFQSTRNALGKPIVYGPYGSAPGQSPLLFMSTCQAFYMNGVFAGAVVVDLCLQPGCGPPTLSQSLASINNGAAAVVYIMQTSNGILLGTSTGAPICSTCYGKLSNNTYIAQSAQYIISNSITQATSVYVPSMQYTITVKFYTNQYSVAVTIVSVDVEVPAGVMSTPAPTSSPNMATYTQPIISIAAKDDVIMGVAAAALAFVLLIVMCLVAVIYKLFIVPTSLSGGNIVHSTQNPIESKGEGVSIEFRETQNIDKIYP